MIGLLKDILCVLKNLVLGVVWALVEVLNLLIVALGAFVGLVLDLLPTMPEPPSFDQPEAVGWIAWFVPASGIMAALVAMGALYVTFLLFRVALRWVKAL